MPEKSTGMYFGQCMYNFPRSHPWKSTLKSPAKSIMHWYLDTPEHNKCMPRLKIKLDESRRQIEQLKKKIDQNEGIKVNEAMDHHLQSVMNEETKQI